MNNSFCFSLIAVLSAGTIWSAEGLDPEAAMKKFTLPENFEVRVWAAEPLLQNPVSFSFDEQGRAFIAETHRLNNSVFDITQNTNWLRDDLAFETVGQRAAWLTKTFGTNVSVLTTYSERLRMVQDKGGGGRADNAKTIAEDFNKVESGLAAGVLARGTNLWFTCIPDLWRFVDANGDGIPDEGKPLHTGFGVHIGVTGHDLHGLAMGPDGRIYFSSGDRGFNVTAGKDHFAFSQTGGVLRCEPDGSHLEVFATGMRNPQELAFDDLGNLFAGDNDTAGPDDCRLLYVVRDADYGWRFSYQHMNGFGPWVQENLWQGGQDGMLPHSGNPAQGPSGLAFYPGTGLPREFDRHFFICDFPGGIWSFELQPKGAGFQLENKKKFAWNLWPTDVEFGPGPGIYFSDWVGGWIMPNQGRIYHLTAKSGVEASQTKERLRENFGARSESGLVELLSFPDYRIRQKAQFELARRRAVAPLLKVALQPTEGSNRARIHALWALGQIGRPDATRIDWQKLKPLWSDRDPEIRAQVSRLATEIGLPTDASELRRLLRDSNARVQFFAAEALAARGGSDATADLVELARTHAEDPFMLHPVIVALSRFASSGELDRLASDKEAGVRRLALLTWRRTGDARVARFLSDPQLVVEAARAIHDVPVHAAFDSLAALVEKAGVPEPVQRRALDANLRVGGPRAAARLAAYARRDGAPAALRAEAIEMLGDWEEPDAVDRIVGLWRPVGKRDASSARREIENSFQALAAEKSEPILIALLDSVRRLKCGVAAQELVALYNDELKTSPVRIKALETLAALHPDEAEQTLSRALEAKDEKIRLLACNLAAKTGAKAVAPRLAALALEDKSIGVRQIALRALTGIDTPQIRAMLKEMVARLRRHEIPDALQLEIIEAIQASPADEIKSLASEAEHSGSRALLAGGNAENGGRIFRERPDVSCLRCHALNGNGGTVGPDLGHIGGAKSAEYLLEAIQSPNKTIAEGFEQVVLRKKDGMSVAGLVKKETAETLVIDSPEDGLLTIPKNQIEVRNRNLSAMPEDIAKMLTHRDLRDLVAYLSTLK